MNIQFSERINSYWGEMTLSYYFALTVYTNPGVISGADYALQTGSQIITYFEGYFNIAYPLEKQDMGAIPDFALGAMENWGLILYR